MLTLRCYGRWFTEDLRRGMQVLLRWCSWCIGGLFPMLTLAPLMLLCTPLVFIVLLGAGVEKPEGEALTSPDGRFVAIPYSWDCGAPCSLRMYLQVADASQAPATLVPTQHLITKRYNMRGVRPQRWNTPRSLLLDQCPSPYDRTSPWRGVSIEGQCP